MKIIIIHYRYYEASGPERYLFNVSKLLKENGHKVIPFSLDFKQNKKSKYSKHFPQPVVDQFHVSQQSNISAKNKLKIIKNSFYNMEVYNNLDNLIKLEKPDIAYILQYGNKLSTSIFDACTVNNIPTVLRLSDFNLLCSKNIFYRDNKICTKCIEGKFSSVKHKCVHDSYMQSFVYYLTQKYNEFRKFEKQIDAIIAPSKFTINQIIKSKQFNNNKFYHVPTFVDKMTTSFSQENNLKTYDLKEGLKLCYFGRIAEDKGIDVLIEAIKLLNSRNLKVSVDVYGDDNNEHSIFLKKIAQNLGVNNIYFKGFISSDEVHSAFKNYHYSVIPSKWYDNMPNSLIESCINGVPAIVSAIGSLDEIIENNNNGFTFEVSNPESLAIKLQYLFEIDEIEYNRLSINVYNWIKMYGDKKTHYNNIINIFRKLNEINN
ncbi:glycosyltransferase [uncultured Polaribacter sp.]|jgi:glycosyltransferase involved in cell wall biosynthesis|uniref:glycosyltransferase n=1 Tax=uncultured Polaribacter sp. TaxID=174711 RepID=UPI002610EA94|nr:glycosyltransferase [uncultured Polaribacter sp.]